MYKIALMRQGDSTWSLENRFTGWTDVDLTPKGVEEAKVAGRLLKEKGFSFELAFTSVLKRANKILNTIREEFDQLWLPVVRSWRLNERHCGALQDLDKV